MLSGRRKMFGAWGILSFKVKLLLQGLLRNKINLFQIGKNILNKDPSVQ